MLISSSAFIVSVAAPKMHDDLWLVKSDLLFPFDKYGPRMVCIDWLCFLLVIGDGLFCRMLFFLPPPKFTVI